MERPNERTSHLRPAMLVAMLALWAGAAQSSIVTYTSASDFVSAVPGSTFETFSAQVAPVNNGDRMTYDYGPFRVDKFSTGGAGSRVGDWQGRPTASLPDVFVFDDPLIAWGGFINTSIGGNGVGIQVYVEFLSGTGEVVGSVGAGANPNDGFIGFLASTAFTTIRLTSVGSGADNYFLDDMSYKMAGHSVPEPGTVALLGVGLLGMSAALRRRRTQV
jgi:hypothetical protein